MTRILNPVAGPRAASGATMPLIDNLSAHADGDELVRWLRSFPHTPRQTFVVHGEPEASATLVTRIERELQWQVRAPALGEHVTLA